MSRISEFVGDESAQRPRSANQRPHTPSSRIVFEAHSVNIEDLRAALGARFEKWIAFLHPAQRGLVERERTGPARVVGSAGTGKTLVALQRALRLRTRVLLTMFSTPLAAALADKLKLMTAERPGVFERATIASFGAAARDLVTLATGRTPFDHIIVDKAQDLGAPGLRFLAGVVSNRSDALLFAGDIGQRIFQQLFSSNALGVDVRGRSATVREPTDSSMGGTGRSPSSRGRRRRTVLALISA